MGRNKSSNNNEKNSYLERIRKAGYTPKKMASLTTIFRGYTRRWPRCDCGCDAAVLPVEALANLLYLVTGVSVSPLQYEPEDYKKDTEACEQVELCLREFAEEIEIEEFMDREHSSISAGELILYLGPRFTDQPVLYKLCPELHAHLAPARIRA